MTRTRRPTPDALPLAERIRAAITGPEWRSLSDLDALVSTRAASGQRRAVHAALRELRAGGTALEERVGAGGVEVRARLVETPAQAMEAVREELSAAPPPAPTQYNCGPCPDPGPGRGCHCRAARGFAFQSDDWCNCSCHIPATTAPTLPDPVPDGYDPAPTPGPGARCARCDAPFVRHATADHPFAPKRRGAHVGPRQRRTQGPIVDVASEADPDVEELPTAEGGLVAALKKSFPDAFAPEIIDGSDVEETARSAVTLDVAFSPVLPRRDSIEPVDVTALDNDRYRLDACWESNGLPIEVSAAELAVMRARYLLLRGVLMRSLPAMDPSMQRTIVDRFFRGVTPFIPPAGSVLATMGAGPITFAVPECVGIEGIDWTALLGALTTPGATLPADVPLRPLGPELPPPPPSEPPRAHLLEGEHGKACDRWKVNEPALVVLDGLPKGFRLCLACWGWVFAAGGGRGPVAKREYVGGRYV